MLRYIDPDQDKTNSPPAPIHQQFDDEGEEQVQDYIMDQYELMDEDIFGRAVLGLYDPTLGSNVVDNFIEEARPDRDDISARSRRY